jgi:UDP-GlcNAc:undecaprenyl-phosphate GlcNAc-1-phosphate transferase
MNTNVGALTVVDLLGLAFLFALSLALSLGLTPLVRWFAFQVGILDRPVAGHPGKIHVKVTPLLGGVAIYVCFMALVLMTLRLDEQLLAVLLGCTFILGLGLFDDIVTLTAKQKLIGQVLPAILVVLAGVYPHLTPFPLINVLLSLLWLVGVTNAQNLMDNVDGVTGGVAALSAFTLAIVAGYYGLWPLSVMAAVLAGAALGFLKYNYHPANIFLGDAGSMFLGFTLGSLSLWVVREMPATPLRGLLPLAVMFVPLLDTTVATTRRLLHRRPIYLPDGSNLTYRLLELGHSRRSVTHFQYQLGMCGALLGLAVVKQVVFRYGAVLAGLGLMLALIDVLRRRHRFAAVAKRESTGMVGSGVPSNRIGNT